MKTKKGKPQLKCLECGKIITGDPFKEKCKATSKGHVYNFSELTNYMLRNLKK